ncbi:GMC oxidoreductase-domain-containing protein [Mycena rosella]|uniref:GMC oxidoreductase-domain-containing protein n=1 Tax=Mycena rosella TaxID=1033263 RepID=A0AAD7CZB0_MYCRO|nr:GMC oxidoreductase-domain-containing protein [Mycena rosella]
MRTRPRAACTSYLPSTVSPAESKLASRTTFHAVGAVAQGSEVFASPDLANGDPHAVVIAPNSIDAVNNTRCSAACAYYTPFATRPNLVIITNATVSHILWANSTGGAKLTARGVVAWSTTRPRVLFQGSNPVRRDHRQPKVGDTLRSILKAAGVTPVLSLPTVGIAAPSNANLMQFAEQFFNGAPRSPQESPRNTRLKDKDLPLEMNAEPRYFGPTSFGARPARNYTIINSVLYAPLSRGHTHIIFSDPLAPPAVNPAYWAHLVDVAAQAGGIKLARTMLTATALDGIHTSEFEPARTKKQTRRLTAQRVGSLSMMAGGLGGVVDTSLKVYGTAKVRIADASIIPFLISAHLVPPEFTALCHEIPAAAVSGGYSTTVMVLMLWHDSPSTRTKPPSIWLHNSCSRGSKVSRQYQWLSESPSTSLYSGLPPVLLHELQLLHLT